MTPLEPLNKKPAGLWRPAGFANAGFGLVYRASAQSPPTAQIQVLWIRVIPIARVVGAGIPR
jgi:hypothetical protein